MKATKSDILSTIGRINFRFIQPHQPLVTESPLLRPVDLQKLKIGRAHV